MEFTETVCFMAIYFVDYCNQFLLEHLLEHPACEIFDRYTSDSTIQKNLHSLVKLLYAEKIVKKVIWPEDGRELLQDIGNRICVNYQILEVFAVVLQNSPATWTIGSNILKEYSK